MLARGASYQKRTLTNLDLHNFIIHNPQNTKLYQLHQTAASKHFLKKIKPRNLNHMRFPFLIHTFHLIFVGWPLPSSYSWCWLRPPGHRSHPAPASGWKCRDPDVEWSSMKSIVPKAWIKNKQTTNHLPACKKMLVLWHDTLKFSERCPRRCMEERPPPPTKKNILGPGIMQHLTRLVSNL